MLLFINHMNKKILFSNQAFSLIELTVVVIVIGILASLAIPRLTDSQEIARAGEGIKILSALRDAQEVYKVEEGAYASDINDLDVTFSNIANFNQPTVVSATATTFDISIDRSSSYNYTLCIDETGTLGCDNDSFCNKLNNIPGSSC